MKLYKYFIMLIFSVIYASCTDDIAPENPEIKPEDDYTEFNLSEEGNESLSEIVSLELDVTLSDPKERVTYSFTGTVNFDPSAVAMGRKGAYVCRLNTGSQKIANGRYFVQIKVEDRIFGGRNLIDFQDGYASQIADAQISYSMLEGNGTEEDPYLVNDAADLLTFLYYLGEDEYHGFGLYFKQTSSFDCPRRSEIIDGRSWTSTYFQGTYDGGGQEIRNLAYAGGGNSADNNIGFFYGLFDASVSNLKIINAIITGGGSNVGLLAGVSEGNSVISNVSISGTVMSDGECTGGLIGRATDLLTLTDIDFSNLTIVGKQNVGTLIGEFDGTRLSIDGVSSTNHVFSVVGDNAVGGVAGYAEAKEKCDFTNITLEHSVDQESSDIRIISANKEDAGGLVGKMALTDNCTVNNVDVKSPVYAQKNAGGLFGGLSIQNGGRLFLEEIMLTSVVHAEDNGGGFFGYLNISDVNSCLYFSGKENAIRYVVKNSAEAHVKGGSHLGCIAGYVAGGGEISFNSSVEIAVNVKGSGDHIGGGFGYIENTKLNLNRSLIFSSPTMRVEGDGNVGGIFGYAKGCKVTGVNEIDITKRIPAASELYSSFDGVVVGKQDTGGIAGFFDGALQGVFSKANVTSSTKAGGIAGRLYGEIRESAFGGDVTAPDDVAGIVACGNGECSIYHCVNFADITGGHRQAGIIAEVVGINSTMGTGQGIKCKTNVWYCANKGNLVSGDEAGGIVSYFYNIYSTDDIPLKYCVNYGDIQAAGSSDDSVGGVAARFNCQSSKMSGCANHGNVSSTEVQKTIGGVVGFAGWDADNDIIVQQCMNSGKITCSKTSTKLGGVVGHIGTSNLHHTAILRDCYNIGELPSDQKDDTGGILGYAASFTDTHRTFNRGKVSHGNAIIGTHAAGSTFVHSHNYYLEGTGGSWPSSTSIKSADISNESKYGDFDFVNVWQMTPSGPILRDCPFQ